jgi:hypothetical protein
MCFPQLVLQTLDHHPWFPQSVVSQKRNVLTLLLPWLLRNMTMILLPQQIATGHP